jgi:hypothetical protein
MLLYLHIYIFINTIELKFKKLNMLWNNMSFNIITKNCIKNVTLVK